MLYTHTYYVKYDLSALLEPDTADMLADSFQSIVPVSSFFKDPKHEANQLLVSYEALNAVNDIIEGSPLEITGNLSLVKLKDVKHVESVEWDEVIAQPLTFSKC